MELILNAEERDLLLATLEQRHRDLLKETWHTDHREFKETLRRDEKVLDALLSRLRGSAVQEFVPGRSSGQADRQLS